MVGLRRIIRPTRSDYRRRWPRSFIGADSAVNRWRLAFKAQRCEGRYRSAALLVSQQDTSWRPAHAHDHVLPNEEESGT